MRRQVLYVDSDTDACRAVTDALDGVATVACVASPEESLDAAADADCVVVGVELPERDYLSVLSALRNGHPETPVVCYPEAGSEALAGEALAAGAAGYVPRSAGDDVLRERVTGAFPEAVPRDGDPSADGADDRAERLESLHATTRDLLRARSKEEVAQLVVDAAASVVPAETAVLYQFAPSAGSLVPAATSQGGHIGSMVAVSADDGILWQRFRSDEPGRVPSFDPTDPAAEDPPGGRPALVYPLDDHGVIAVTGRPDADLDRTASFLLSILAATATAAFDRAERERDLARSETIIDAIGDGVYTLDRRGTITSVNDRVVEVSGRGRDDLLGEHVSTLLPATDVVRGEEFIRDLLDDDGPEQVTYEVTLQTADGGDVPCEVTMSLLPGDSDFAGTVGSMRVVTERKEMERELRAHKRKVEHLHEVASRLDQYDDRQSVFDAAVTAAGSVLDADSATVSTAVDGTLVAMAGTDDAVVDQTGVADRAHRTGQPQRVGDHDGPADARSVLSVPIGDHGVLEVLHDDPDAFGPEDAELAELLAAHVADALEHIQFETDLRTERDRFAALFENVPNPVVATLHGDDGPIVQAVNPAFEGVFGFADADIVGERLDAFVVPPDWSGDPERMAEHAPGEVLQTEVRRRTTEGVRDFLLTVVPIDRDEPTLTTYAVYTDITERKQREQRVEVLNRVLRHDLRNGMNIIAGNAEMVQELAGDAELARYADGIAERAEELLSLAEKTRAVEQTLARDERSAGPVDAVAVVRQAADRLGDEFPAAEVSLDLPEAAQVVGDDLLAGAVYHVMENAVVHHDGDAPAVDVSVDVGEDTVTVAVADEGPGLPDAERELLTEDREITQLRHASGLGLWFVNWVVAQSGGDVTFTDNEPRGTVVTLHLPLASAVRERHPSTT